MAGHWNRLLDNLGFGSEFGNDTPCGSTFPRPKDLRAWISLTRNQGIHDWAFRRRAATERSASRSILAVWACLAITALTSSGSTPSGST